MKVHETRSPTNPSAEDEGKIGIKKHRAENKGLEAEAKTKKAKVSEDDNGHANGKSEADVGAEFDEFCKLTKEHLSVDEMRRILEANDQDGETSDAAIVLKCQDIMFYGPLERCPVCNGSVMCTGSEYACKSSYSEWSTCTYSSRDHPRKEQPLKLPDEIKSSVISEWIKNQNPTHRPHRALTPPDKPFTGMMISLSGRFARTHHTWRTQIEKCGGKVYNAIVPGVTCLVVSPAERERGGASKVAEAMEMNIPVVREAWLVDSIEKQAPQSLEAYDLLTDLAPEGRGIPWDKQDPSEEAIESLSSDLKVYGKRGVHKDSKLQDQGGSIFEKDGILYNCAFSLCDKGREINDYCVMQLIMLPGNHLHLYYKKGSIGDDPNAEERLDERTNIDGAIKEFAALFQELTGNEFEPWEKEKKFTKKPLKFFPIDMDDGVEVRHGGLGVRQLGVAAMHSKLEPLVANFMKVLCSQEIYRYAMMEMALDCPDLPTGMVSAVHLSRCEQALVEFTERLDSDMDSEKARLLWADFSNKWFTLLHSARPLIISSFQDLADHAAASLEAVRDITVASHVIGDMSGATIDDPLSDRYKRLGCSIAPLEKESEDYKMILDYLEKTYEPVKVADVSYGMSVDNIFSIESSACPSFDEVKKLPNKVLLWCGTRSSNLLRHLHKGFLPAACYIPVPGYVFGRAIVCSDAAAEAARYGFTAVDRPEGFLILAVASLGDKITEISSPPKDPKALEEKKAGVKGLGRKKTDESQHKTWRDDIKVPCGSLIPSDHKDSPLEYNEYAVYDPKQVRVMFVVSIKFEEQNVEMVAAE